MSGAPCQYCGSVDHDSYHCRPETRDDPVSHPKHYTSHPSGIEAIVVCEHYGFNIGNAIKYLWRGGLKSPSAVEDYRKAAWYINREIERLTK
jgi:hypothetical protein